MSKSQVCLIAVSILIGGCSSTVGNHSLEERQRLSMLHSRLSFEFILNQNIDVALGEAQEAIRLNPAGVESNHAMARVQQALNDHEQTLIYYRRALDADPDSVFVLNDLGQYLCDQGQPDQAIEAYNRAGRQLMSTLRIVSYTRAAACSVKYEKYDEASEYLLMALEYNADSTVLLLNLARVSYLNQDYRAAGEYLERYLAVAQTPSVEAKHLAGKLKKEL